MEIIIIGFFFEKFGWKSGVGEVFRFDEDIFIFLKFE